tara:strand:+ start:168 stop:872 length:705 start_codon:yes stop_codon:yes gene_type:complete
MNWKIEAEKHAENIFPDESCGLLAIIEGEKKYWPCKNLSNENFDYFIMDPEDYAKCEDQGEVIGLIHSHPHGSPYPSETDKAGCEFSGLEWHIYSLENKNWHSFKPSDWKPETLIGREWAWGLQDCWSLICDYYKEKLNIEIKKWPRPKTIKSFAENPYFEKVLYGSGFKKIDFDEIQKNDVLLMKGAYEKLNHVALYIGDQTILHHVIGKLSCREIYNLEYQQITKKIFRYDP